MKLWTVLSLFAVLSAPHLAHSSPARPAMQSPAPPPPSFLTATTAEIGRPFTVVDSTCVFQAFPKTASSDDPLEEALSGAFARARKIAADAGANGLIGYDVDFANPVGKEPGRLLLCGTLVKIR